MTWQEHLARGNELAAGGDDTLALAEYDLAVAGAPPPTADIAAATTLAQAQAMHPLARRALCHERLLDHPRALEDALALGELGAPDAAAPRVAEGTAALALLIGRCWLDAGNVANAEAAFVRAGEIGADAAACERGVRKCRAMASTTGVAETSSAAASSAPAATTGATAAAAGSPAAPAAAPAAPAAAAAAAAAPSGPAPPRFSYYQSDGTVTVDIFVKGTTADEVEVRAEPGALHFTHPSCAPLTLHLFAEIDPATLAFDCKKPKIEVRLAKRVAGLWSALERPAGSAGFGAVSVGAMVDVPADDGFRPEYPSSSMKKKNWDAIDSDIKKEEAEEKPQGEDALNHLLKGIYANASEETKRAMNKSYQESGGTVLSTNWSEVGKKPVKGSAPKGMVMKKWGTDEIVATDADPIDKV
jgi:suppressor of G2 allele of SKP1